MVVLAVHQRLNEWFFASGNLEFLQGDPQGRSFKDHGQNQHHVIPADVLQLPWVKNMLDALVQSNPAAQCKNQDRHNKAPEKHLFAIAERMVGVGRFLPLANAEQQQDAISRIHQGMNPLRKHRGRTREKGGDKFTDRDEAVRRDGTVNGFFG